MPLIEKFDNRLTGWKCILLSVGGQLTLLILVLRNLPSFFMANFKLPSWVIARIDKVRSHFFWNENLEVLGGRCLAQWKIVCRPKYMGGLG